MQKLLNLIPKSQEKFIILNDEGQPQAVILPFSEYQKLKKPEPLT